ncbi:MAG: glycosyltransferase [Bacilli bacterium]|nr:glycosyltransferase [Bacilli bacterium]
MVITFICEVLGEENNGTTIATMNVVRYLRSQGHEVHIVCPDEDKRGVEGYLVLPRIHFGPLDNYVAHNGVVLASAHGFKKNKELLALIEKSDVVHFNFASKLTLRSAKYAHAHGVACTASFHTQAENFTNHVYLMRSRFANWVIYLFLNHRLFKQVDAIHYPTQFMHDIFRRHHYTPAREYIISNGTQSIFHRQPSVRPERFKDMIVITSTGRYSNEKCQTTLLKAMKYSRYADKIQIILAGDGPMKAKLEKKGKKYCKVPPILGFYSHDELASILNYTDLYCHCSYADLEAISCLEAISVGICPILSDSRLSAVSQFAVDEKNVYRHGSAKALAKRIDYWIEHPEERKANADKYLGAGEKYNLEDMMRQMEAMYLETIALFNKKEEGR